ncbi:MAG: hypothetical protein F9K19_07675 [Rhizobiaceae bacterium]|nr:MAG: hypothetical protein F9K19_07675 [Rhizobiaceae bacterium]CAG0992501.1 hypothetical protein RHIZO_02327 [Rhizobiaceae bacterium]
MATRRKSPAAPETAAAGAIGSPQYLDHLKKINDIYYDQIRIADQKAAYIFTFMLAFLVSSAEGRGVFKLQRYLTGDPLAIALSAILALAVVVSLVSAILVVLPRHRATSTSLYWGGWPANREVFLTANASLDQAYLFEQYLGNVDNLSAINRAKYRFVGFAFRGLLVAVVTYVLLLGAGVSATSLS